MRRMRSCGCARAADGNSAAPQSVMKSRRLIGLLLNEGRMARRMTDRDAILTEVDEILPEINAIFHPGADNVVGDGVRERRDEILGMAPGEHQRHLLAVEPARVGELGA